MSIARSKINCLSKWVCFHCPRGWRGLWSPIMVLRLLALVPCRIKGNFCISFSETLPVHLNLERELGTSLDSMWAC